MLLLLYIFLIHLWYFQDIRRFFASTKPAAPKPSNGSTSTDEEQKKKQKSKTKVEQQSDVHLSFISVTGLSLYCIY